jgi:hypothetical protein
MTEVAHIFRATFFHIYVMLHIIFEKKWDGMHFVRFFHELIWSPCRQTVWLWVVRSNPGSSCFFPKNKSCFLLAVFAILPTYNFGTSKKCHVGYEFFCIFCNCFLSRVWLKRFLGFCANWKKQLNTGFQNSGAKPTNLQYWSQSYDFGIEYHSASVVVG